MKRAIVLGGLALIFLGGWVGYAQVKTKGERKVEKKKESISVTTGLVKLELNLITVYDNYQYEPSLKTGWGFACLIKFKDENILFDTGADSPTLLYNLGKLGIDPKEIKTIFLSHIHQDHVGGLFGVLERNAGVEVFLPASFPRDFKEKIKSYGAKVIEISKPTKIADGLYSTGEMGILLKEQSLIVKTEKGLVIITGCAHPGIVNILKKAKEIHPEEIYLVLGGFHLNAASDSGLKSIVKSFKELGVKKAAPCHCSGDRCRELFRQEYNKDFIENGVGRIINL